MGQEILLALFVADLCPAGLKIPGIGDRADLAVFVLTGQPHFKVDRFRCAESQVAGAESDQPVRQFEGFEQVRGAGDHFVEYFVAFIGFADGDELDLVELMLANHPPGIASGGTGFFTETGGKAGHLDRQLVRRKDLVLKEIGQRYFGRWDQVEVFTVDLEKVLFEFRQLPGAFERTAVDEFGHAHFHKTAFAVEVEHEVYQSAFDACTHTKTDAEAAFGQLDTPLEIDPLIGFGQFPVLFGHKVEMVGLEYPSDFNVIILVDTVGNVGIRHVRYAHRQLHQRLLGFALRLLQFGDADFVRIDFRFEFGDVLALFFILPEKAAHLVLFRLRLFKSGFGVFEGLVTHFEFVEQFGRDIFAHQGGADAVKIFLQQFKIDHCIVSIRFRFRNYSERGYNYGMNEAIYKQRRDALLAEMREGAAVIGASHQKVRSNDTEYPYRQNSDFYYLTGFEEDNAVLLLIKAGASMTSYLFVQPKDEKMELWTGKRLGVDAAKERFKVEEVFSVDEFEQKLPELLQNLPILYGDIFADDTWFAEAKRAAEKLRHKRETKRPVSQLIDITRLIRTQRLIKSEAEIDTIRKGLEITAQAHHHAMRVCRPGMMEYALQAEYEYLFKKNGAYSDAYTTIIAGGDHANTLHYIKNDAPLNDGDLVLIDAGCEYRHYATDITRTFPVNGRFSQPQREIYEAVLEVQEAVISQIAPGILKSELQKNAEWLLCTKMVELGILSGEIDALIEAKAHKRYFPHGIGHWMGIDVHDPAPYYDDDGMELPLRSGMIMTIEPGLYLPASDTQIPERYRGIGIRIEDDILVTETGNENLSIAIAKTLQEIENICLE